MQRAGQCTDGPGQGGGRRDDRQASDRGCGGGQGAEDDLMAVGSGGPYAQAAARALLDNTALGAATQLSLAEQ